MLSKPILQALPLPSDAGNSALAIGAIIGNAARVEVVFRGSAVLAPVVVIPTGRAAMVDAYAVWLPTSGTDTYRWSDITEVTARDAPAGSSLTCPELDGCGRVVAARRRCPGGGRSIDGQVVSDASVSVMERWMRGTVMIPRRSGRRRRATPAASRTANGR